MPDDRDAEIARLKADLADAQKFAATLDQQLGDAASDRETNSERLVEARNEVAMLQAQLQQLVTIYHAEAIPTVEEAFNEGFWAGDAAHESKESVADTRQRALARFREGHRHGTDQMIKKGEASDDPA